MEEKVRNIIEQRLGELVGQNMTRLFRWEVMTCYVFENDKGEATEIHTYSRCVISKDNVDIIDSNNVTVPAKGVEPEKDDDYGIGDCVFDRQYWAMKDLFPLTVISAEVKDDGTIRMRLSDGCHFTIIPWPDVDGEAWRIFRPKDNTSHLVYYGNGTIDG